jgi:RNA polymerase sigma-70 factor, ECF subfamily
MLAPDDLDRIYREEFGQVVASLISAFGDIDVAEDAVQEAFAIATERWQRSGPPPNPGGWITTTARRRAIDRLRREARREDRQAQAKLLHQDPASDEVGFLQDDRLRLIFTCCHPALAVETRVALTLRLLAGLRTSEIARAFLVSESAMEQRLVRAKRKIRANRLPYRVPEAHELPDRLRAVTAVIYLVFNEGHTATDGDPPVRVDLTDEAIRLARLLAALLPDQPEVLGLLALLLLSDARRGARVAPGGRLVALPDQDRTRWDRDLVAEGRALVRACLRHGRPGPYQLQAAISAVHADAVTFEDTDWHQILVLYDQLLAVAPSPVAALNRAVAVAEVSGPATALTVLDGLDLGHYQPYHAVRADLLQRLGRHEEALEAYDVACALTANAAERRFLEARRQTSLRTGG